VSDGQKDVYWHNQHTSGMSSWAPCVTVVFWKCFRNLRTGDGIACADVLYS